MRRVLCFIVLWAACGLAAAADGWTLEALGGSAYNFRNRLKIIQDGGFSESVDAKYETRGLRSPPYYLLRVARWQGDYGTEVSLLHHKLYLTNPPAGVSDLSVSHGFNIVSFNGAYRRGDWIFRFGAGPVITHAEATINGTRYDGRYRVSGVGALAGAGRRFYLRESLFLSVEAMASAAFANPKLDGTPSAELRVRNVALHALVGVGYEF